MKILVNWVILLLIAVSCIDIVLEDNTILTTEELVYVSAERAFLRGRLHSLAEPGEVLGFEISEDADFTNPIAVSTNTSVALGAYIIRFNQLTASTDYHGRAYVVTGDKVTYGKAISFRTLASDLTEFYPKDAKIGDIVTIIGANFFENTRVFFGDQEAEILNISLEYRITTVVPDIGDQSIVDLRVVTGEEELTFEDQFEYHIGVWQKEGEFPERMQLTTPVIIEEDEDVILGFGDLFLRKSFNERFWRINKSTLSFTEIAPPEGAAPVSEPILFGNGYCGGKLEFLKHPTLNSFESWYWDGSNWNSNGLVPFDLRAAIALESNEEFFIVGGGLQQGPEIVPSHAIYRGDLQLNNWQQEGRNTQVDATSRLAHFVYEGDLIAQIDSVNFFRYNARENLWSHEFRSPIEIGELSIAAVIDGIAYLGLGRENKEILAYNLETKEIKRKNFFVGSIAERNVAHWTHNGKLYVIRTTFRGLNAVRGLPMEIWSFNPTQLK